MPLATIKLKLLPMQEPAEEAVGHYATVLTDVYNSRMASKLGLRSYKRDVAVGLLTAMFEDRADFTNTFRALADVRPEDEPSSIPASLQAVTAMTRLATDSKDAGSTYMLGVVLYAQGMYEQQIADIMSQRSRLCEACLLPLCTLRIPPCYTKAL